jgi:hypothetical protein
VSGRVGDGGDVTVKFDDRTMSIGKNVGFLISGGMKGDGTTNPGGSASSGGQGGKGSGKSTMNGYARYQIPMTAPYVKAPKDGAILSSMPVFQWEQAHDTGPTPAVAVKGYLLEISQNSTMADPIYGPEDIPATVSSKSPDPLDGGQYYWRIKTKYGDADKDVISSPVMTFYFNKPPWVKKPLPAIIITEDKNVTSILKLDNYFTDDLYPDTIVYGIVPDQNNVQHFITLNLSGDRNEFLSVNTSLDFSGQETFNLSAKDQGGLVGYSGLVTVIVRPDLKKPPRVLPIADQELTEDVEAVIYLSDLIFDSKAWHPINAYGPAIYSLSSINVKTDSKYITITKDSTTNPPTINMVMDFTLNGTFYVNLTVSNSNGASSTVPFTVNVSAVNDPPEILPIPDIVMPENLPKVIDLKQYSSDEEDGPMKLSWSIRVQDKKLMSFQLEEGNILRLLPNPEMYGDTVLYLKATDRNGAFDSSQVKIKVTQVDDPPALNVKFLNLPKGVEYKLDIKTIMKDPDSDINKMSVTNINFSNATNGVTLTGLTTAVFNYPDGTNINDTLTISVESEGATATYALPVNLGYAPALKKKLPKISFLSDEEYSIDLAKYVTDKDSNMSDLKWEVTGYDDTFISPQINSATGKLTLSSQKAGKGNMTIVARDKMGFELRQDVKVSVTSPTAMTFFNRNPAVLIGLILVIVIVVLMVVLIVVSKKTGKPFKSLKKAAPEAEAAPTAPVGLPPPPPGFTEGLGPGVPPEAPPTGPGAPTAPITGPAAPVPVPPPAGPELVPPPTPVAPSLVPPSVPVAPVPASMDPAEREAKKRIRELKRKERHGELTEKEEEELGRLESGSDAPASAGPTKCPKCGDEIEPAFIKCPSCGEILKK